MSHSELMDLRSLLRRELDALQVTHAALTNVGSASAKSTNTKVSDTQHRLQADLAAVTKYMATHYADHLTYSSDDSDDLNFLSYSSSRAAVPEETPDRVTYLWGSK